MRNRDPYNTLAFIARFAVIGLAVAFVLNALAPGVVDRLRGTSSGGHSASARLEGSPATSNRGPVSYADAVLRASPAVVNISANKVTTFRRILIVSLL